MIDLQGKYANAKVFTDIIDESSASQIIELCNQEIASGATIRIMPDVHAGIGVTVGTTMTITDKVIPNMVGVDIGCGMETIRIDERNIEFLKLDKLIRNKIPSGFGIRSAPHRFYEKIDLSKLRCYRHINEIKASKSLGSLGGGNHFIEVAKDSKNKIYIIIHSGSRHLGLEVAKFYQNEGYKKLNKSSDDDVKILIDQLKSDGKDKQIQKEMKKLINTKQTNIPRTLAYVEGELFDDYIHDMKIVQEFALLNRKAMADEIVKGMKFHIKEQFSTIHNYIDTENMILRKGAVSALKDEKLLIPINMRDGSLICVGKGNPDWNFSAPHGAGRLMSRTQAKESFTVSEFKKVMNGIFTTSIGKDTLDECPMAYKEMNSILQNIGGTAEVMDVIKPLYNFKAGS